MKLPPWLVLPPNAQIAVIAPGSIPFDIDQTKLQQQIAAFLTNLGFKADISPTLFGYDLLCANNDTERFNQLVAGLTNDANNAIWCLRGGYGCTRLLPRLKDIAPPKQAKLLIGFSDITALHIFLQQQWGWPVLHGPTLNQAINGNLSPIDIETLRIILSGKQSSVTFSLIPMNHLAYEAKQLRGTVTGGNLSLIQVSLNTFWQIQTEGKFLLLEDTHERGYRIDRILQHLKQAGVFKGVQALLLGDFVAGLAPNKINEIKNVLQRFADESDFPVLQIPGIGHGTANHPLPLGIPSQLALGNRATLEVLLNK